MPNGSYAVSDMQDFIEYIIKKNEIFTTFPPIHSWINRINNRSKCLKQKMDISYNDIKMPEKWKLFDTIKK